MLVLNGTALSNYYNKVKMALLEKGLPFSERFVPAYGDEAQIVGRSPLARVPFITTANGPLCESQVIVDYIEAVCPEPPLVPRDPYEAAKVKEIIVFIEWNLDMLARELYDAVFFKRAAPPAARVEAIRRELPRRIRALRSLARFAPFIAGETFTIADCAAYNTLPLVAITTRATWGSDFLADAGIDLRSYKSLIGGRASAQAVDAARKLEANRQSTA